MVPKLVEGTAPSVLLSAKFRPASPVLTVGLFMPDGNESNESNESNKSDALRFIMRQDEHFARGSDGSSPRRNCYYRSKGRTRDCHYCPA